MANTRDLPWGRAVGEISGSMMLPAIMAWIFSLPRLAALFWFGTVLVNAGLTYFIYHGSVISNPEWKATFDAILVILGSVVAAGIIAFCMRGKWR